MSLDDDIPFQDQARLGFRGFGRHVVAFAIIGGLGIGFTVLLFLGVVEAIGSEGPVVLDSLMRNPPDDWSTVPPSARLAFMLIGLGSIAVWLIGLWIAVVLVHRRPFRTVLTGAARFRWSHLLVSYAVLLLLSLALLPLDGVFWDEGLELSFDPEPFFYMLPWIAGLMTVQVLAEEVAFRGYLLQTVRLLVPTPIAWGLVTLAFAFVHGLNKEVVAEPAALIYFVIVGGYLTFLTIRGNGLETALGVHLATNTMALLVVGNSLSNYPVATVFHVHDPDLALTVVSGIVVLALHYVLLYGAIRLPRD